MKEAMVKKSGALTFWPVTLNVDPPVSRLRRTCMKLDCRRMRYYGIAVGVVVSIAWAIVAWVWLS
jgi:hypothetical protein